MRVVFEDYPREVFDVMMSDNIMVVYCVNDDAIIFFDPLNKKVRYHNFKHPGWYRDDNTWTDADTWKMMICGRLYHEWLVRTLKEKLRDEENK